MRVIFAGGGTAGHINPAIAIADHIKSKYPDSEILFVGTEKGMEKNLVPRAGYDISYIEVQGFVRKISFENFYTILKLFSSIKQSKDIIRKFAPDIVVGTGGYVCGPVLFAASKMKIPNIIHESNAFAGLASKLVAKNVSAAAVAFSDAVSQFSKAKKVVVTGNPIREELFNISSMRAKAKLNLDDRPVIAAFGGSLGAKALNSAVVDFISSVAHERKYQIIMGTGRGSNYTDTIQELKDKGVNINNYPEIKILEYIYDMDLVLNAADLVIARSGANTVCEICALGKPAIFIPSPNVTHNHQEYNARAVEKCGGAIVIIEKELKDKAIYDIIKMLFENKKTLNEMAEKSKKMGIRNANEKILSLINEIIKDSKQP